MTSDPMMSNPHQPASSRPDYYATDGKYRKISDGVVGAGIAIVGGFILNFVLGFILMAVSVDIFGGSVSAIIGISISVLAIFLAARMANQHGRRYITIGILSTAVVPLLIFGACLSSL